MTNGDDLRPQDHYELIGAALGTALGGFLGPHGAHAGLKLGVLAGRWFRQNL